MLYAIANPIFNLPHPDGDLHVKCLTKMAIQDIIVCDGWSKSDLEDHTHTSKQNETIEAGVWQSHKPKRG